MCEVITVYCQVKVMIDIIANGLPFTSCLSLTLPTHTPAPQPLPGIRVAGGCLFCFLCSRPPGFDSCPCLSPGEPSLRKRSSESALQHQPPAKTVVRCDMYLAHTPWGSIPPQCVSTSSETILQVTQCGTMRVWCVVCVRSDYKLSLFQTVVNNMQMVYGQWCVS